MTYEVYMMIYNVGAILTIIMFVVSMILFFVLKIPAVIGDLSGSTARKAIENIRNQNEESGEKVHKSSAVNKERGKLTDKISPSGTLHSKPSDKLGFAMKTEKISTQKLENEASNETTVLSSGNETSVLNGYVGETSVLNEATVYNETSLLSPDMMQVSESVDFGNTGKLPLLSGFFVIEQEITFVHTNEVIGF